MTGPSTLRHALVLVVALAGCESGESQQRVVPPAATGFSAEEGPTGPAVYLKGHVDRERVVVDVIARGAPDIHGVAFRLFWDTAKLGFVEARGSDAWSRQALHLSKEGAPGELVITWTEKGTAAAVDAREDTRLGSIDFVVKTHDGAVLAFRTERSMLLDSKGAPIAVAWRGGNVLAR